MKRATTVFCTMLFLLTGVALAQDVAQPSSQSQPAHRITMTECEGIDNCTTWIFLSDKGYGKWRTGEESVLEVKSAQPDKVVILRTDVTGSKAGLTSTYEGTLSDGQLGGKYTYSYNGKTGSGRWYAILGSSYPNLPAVMRVCANPNDWTVCSMWTWNSDHYDGWREWGAIATMTVESFTPESVVIRRTDTGPPGPGHPGAGFTMVYRGTISSQGDSILDGISEGTGGAGGPFKAYWGSALRDLPPAKHPMLPQQLQAAPSGMKNFVDFTDFVKALAWWHDQLSSP